MIPDVWLLLEMGGLFSGCAHVWALYWGPLIVGNSHISLNHVGACLRCRMLLLFRLWDLRFV